MNQKSQGNQRRMNYLVKLQRNLLLKSQMARLRKNLRLKYSNVSLMQKGVWLDIKNTKL